MSSVFLSSSRAEEAAIRHFQEMLAVPTEDAVSSAADHWLVEAIETHREFLPSLMDVLY